MTTEIYTTNDVAARLGITARRVMALAQSRRLGRKHGPMWVFTEADILAMRFRRPGRPRASTERNTVAREAAQ